MELILYVIYGVVFLWFVLEAFKVSIPWGIVVFLFPPGIFLFTVLRFNNAWKPLFALIAVLPIAVFLGAPSTSSTVPEEVPVIDHGLEEFIE